MKWKAFHFKGKIEALNKIIKHEFQDEAGRAGMQTLQELNTAFWAWSELSFNKRIHSATGQTPDKRFVDGLPSEHRRIEDVRWFLSLFLWRENRTVSKYGKIKLHGNEYPVSKRPARTVVQVRFDPCDLREVFLYDHNETFLENTWPSKQRTITAPGIPEEQQGSAPQISESSRKFFSDLRKQYLATINETNQIDFSRFHPTETDKETPDE